MRVFSLFLRHRQIKFGAKRRFGLIGHGFDDARQAFVGLIPSGELQPVTAATKALLFIYRRLMSARGKQGVTARWRQVRETPPAGFGDRQFSGHGVQSSVSCTPGFSAANFLYPRRKLND
jgi:hypothetical protein